MRTNALHDHYAHNDNLSLSSRNYNSNEIFVTIIEFKFAVINSESNRTKHGEPLHARRVLYFNRQNTLPLIENKRHGTARSARRARSRFRKHLFPAGAKGISSGDGATEAAPLSHGAFGRKLTYSREPDGARRASNDPFEKCAKCLAHDRRETAPETLINVALSLFLSRPRRSRFFATVEIYRDSRTSGAGAIIVLN